MEKVVVLTGAGMSADSGLQTFRDAGGLWEGYEVSEVATVQAWKKNPEKVLAFYNDRRKQAHQAKPHAGHRALVALENDFDVTIITQNVDDLHERAGSSHVLHLHGQLRKARSVKDDTEIIDIGVDAIKMGDVADDGGQLRPHVVWFGEMVPNVEVAAEIMPKADRLLVVGTSLVVYPAAGLVDYVRPGVPKYVVDPNKPELPRPQQWKHVQRKAEKGVTELVEELTSKK